MIIINILANYVVPENIHTPPWKELQITGEGCGGGRLLFS